MLTGPHNQTVYMRRRSGRARFYWIVAAGLTPAGICLSQGTAMVHVTPCNVRDFAGRGGPDHDWHCLQGSGEGLGRGLLDPIGAARDQAKGLWGSHAGLPWRRRFSQSSNSTPSWISSQPVIMARMWAKMVWPVVVM